MFKALKIFCDLFNGPDPSYIVLKFGHNLFSRKQKYDSKRDLIGL